MRDWAIDVAPCPNPQTTISSPVAHRSYACPACPACPAYQRVCPTCLQCMHNCMYSHTTPCSVLDTHTHMHTHVYLLTYHTPQSYFDTYSVVFNIPSTFDLSALFSWHRRIRVCVLGMCIDVCKDMCIDMHGDAAYMQHTCSIHAAYHAAYMQHTCGIRAAYVQHVT